MSRIVSREMKLPRLLDIFLPSEVHQPWAKTHWGSGSSSAISMHGQ